MSASLYSFVSISSEIMCEISDTYFVSGGEAALVKKPWVVLSDWLMPEVNAVPVWMLYFRCFLLFFATIFFILARTTNHQRSKSSHGVLTVSCKVFAMWVHRVRRLIYGSPFRCCCWTTKITESNSNTWCGKLVSNFHCQPFQRRVPLRRKVLG